MPGTGFPDDDGRGERLRIHPPITYANSLNLFEVTTESDGVDSATRQLRIQARKE